MNRTQELNEQLFNAVRYCAVKRVEKFIESGADVNIKDNDGSTPLSVAIKRGHLRILEMLIAAGANIHERNGSGETPLHFAFKSHFPSTIRPLVKAGADIDAKDKDGWTPLCIAITRGAKIAEMLIAEGANIHLQNKSGETPLSLAFRYGSYYMVKVLIKAGIDIDANDKDGWTNLNAAVRTGLISIAELTVNHIVALEVVSLCVSEESFQTRDEFMNSLSSGRLNNYLQHFQDCKEEAKELERDNKPLHDFLRASEINSLVSIWETNKDLINKFDNQESLEEQYPKYAYILINKANAVKKEIFLHNHKPLTDALSTYYGCDIETMTFTRIKNFLELHRNELKAEILGVRNNTLIYFVDFDVARKYIPALKVKAFAEFIKNKDKNTSSNFDNPNTEQHQRLDRLFN